MLEFILGRACSGKTKEILNRAVSASQNGAVVLIVPEQFTFETERAVIKYEKANTDNIKILSFTRLYDEVMQSFGRGQLPCVSEFEKIILMKRALKSSQLNLAVFSKYVDYRDFCKSMSDTIRDIKFAGVDEDELRAAAKKIGGTLGAKLDDISLIMSVYDSLLQDKYIDPTDRLTKLYFELETLDYFKGKTVLFDSFTGFTGQQYKIIERIFEQTKDVAFSFTTDNPDSVDINTFYNINFAINKIKDVAESRAIKGVRVSNLSINYYSNPAMSNLERLMALNMCDKNTQSKNNIRIISCKNPREEAVAAANVISNEVRQNGYRYKDFVVVARNADNYSGYVARQCKTGDIACFMDNKVNLSSTLIGIYITTLFELVKSYGTDNIFKLLKLGLLDFSTEEIAELEDYTYIWDIKGSDWKNEWKMSVRGFQTDEDNEHDAEALVRINEYRTRVYDIISKFKSNFDGTPLNRSKALYKHLIENEIDKKLSVLCGEFESEGDNFNASLLKQSWDKLVTVLDSMCRVLDKTSYTNNEYIDAFIIASEICEISNVPQMLDEVTFGAADRIRPSKPKISIILGANQGVFPSHSSKNGILIQSDKDKLSEYDIFLDDSVRSAVEENYLVYAMLCCPVDKVYVLYSQKSMSGESLEPSAFITKITENISDVSVTEFALTSDGEFTPQTAKSAFLEIGSIKKGFCDVVKSLEDYSQYKDKLDKMTMNSEDVNYAVSKESALKLFGKELHISATKFDIFHKCSLSYFLKSGLRIRKLQKADLNVLQRGTLVHYVLEKIIEKHREKLGELSDLQISVEVDNLVHEYLSLIKGSEVLMNARFAFLIEKISASVKEIVYHLSSEFAQSGFEPKFCELTIGDDCDIPRIEYTLSDGSIAYFDGKIDRVDVYKNNVRVIDYKTGKVTFSLSDTLAGLNMQMLLYLYAFIKNGGGLVDEPQPAGILYMPAKTSNKSKSLKMNGLISDNNEIIAAMEKDNAGCFIPKYSDKSESFIGAGSFKHIFAQIEKLMLNMGDTIREGQFSASPTDSSSKNACAYCDFASICRSANKEHKVVDKLTNSEVIEILKRGEEGAV